MAYKFKPNKAIAKRFRVTAKGKLKRGHSLTSHLRSARTAKKKRELRRPEILFEGLARNMRKLMGLGRLKPGQARHKRDQLMAAKAQGSSKPALTTNSK